MTKLHVISKYVWPTKAQISLRRSAFWWEYSMTTWGRIRAHQSIGMQKRCWNDSFDAHTGLSSKTQSNLYVGFVLPFLIYKPRRCQGFWILKVVPVILLSVEVVWEQTEHLQEESHFVVMLAEVLFCLHLDCCSSNLEAYL